MSKISKISIIIPVYNEKNTIQKCVDRVLGANVLNFKKEIIISDNCSTDGTIDILKKFNDNQIKVLFRDKNEGKGANLINAIQYATGDIVIFQDADLEYSPEDYVDLLKPFIKYNADVVYGTRLTGAKEYRVLGLPNLVANKLLTWIANILFNTTFSDIETGYKLIKLDKLKDLKLKSKGFEIETEFTAKISKNKELVIFETPITIFSRKYNEGKKVRWWHFFTSLYSLIKWRLINND
jgi:glycosyltransferase involved in cell wall biosynthesis